MSRIRRLPAASIWTAAATALAVFFYLLALSSAAYELTSPHWLTFHVLLRKAYSIGAFAAVGFCAAQALRVRGNGGGSIAAIALWVAGYSALIEISQALVGSHEGLVLNAVDVLCGLAGGLLGAALSRTAWRKKPAGIRSTGGYSPGS